MNRPSSSETASCPLSLALISASSFTTAGSMAGAGEVWACVAPVEHSTAIITTRTEVRTNETSFTRVTVPS
jgi:hypothetical protein